MIQLHPDSKSVEMLSEICVDPAYTDLENAPVRPHPGHGEGFGDRSIPVTLVDRTNAIIRGLDLILEHHRVHHTIRVALSNQVHDYLDTALDESVWLKRGKFLLSYPLAQYLRNTIPDFPPGGPFKPHGPLRSWMKIRLLAYNRKNTHLWTSWLQAKRSALPASDEMINRSYDDHFATLHSEDPGDDEIIDQIMSSSDFINHLDLVRTGVIRNYLMKDSMFTHRQPSLSASLDSTRSQDGAYNDLYRMAMKYSPDKDRIINYTHLQVMTFSPRLRVGKDLKYNVTVESRIPFPEDYHDWNDLNLYKWMIEDMGTLTAKIQGIVEPMKVRVISKGPALDYYSMKPLQEALHSTLRELSPYELIGRPFSPTDVLDVVPDNPSSDLKWISVDYKGATDNLSWKYSKRILQYVIQDLPSYEQETALSVLGPHLLQYPKEDGKGYEDKPRGIMRRGQLMGSILSFPILCLANMGLYLLVTGKRQLGMSTKDRTNLVKINGDDQLYLGTEQEFQDHIYFGNKVGLEMSVGKAYIHSRYSNINSTSIDCVIGSPHPYQINYLNTGLYFGQNKVLSKKSIKGEDNRDTRPNVTTVLNRVLSGSLPGRQATLLKGWLVFHKKSISEDCAIEMPRGTHYRNLFLPESMGGMGVNPPRDWRFFVTKDDRKYANSITSGKLLNHCDTQRPLRSTDAISISSSLSVPWNSISKPFFTPTCCQLRTTRWTCESPFSVSRVRMAAIPFGIAVLA